jgi:hypothetical protein
MDAGEHEPGQQQRRIPRWAALVMAGISLATLVTRIAIAQYGSSRATYTTTRTCWSEIGEGAPSCGDFDGTREQLCQQHRVDRIEFVTQTAGTGPVPVGTVLGPEYPNVKASSFTVQSQVENC